ncbi:MAG TPA: 3'(2'),5'-bisphosphate nucleotidase CysQ [Candidatus Limnocylindrales bacterium]
MITHAPQDLSALDDARLAAALAAGAGEVLLGLRLQADADHPDGDSPDTAAADLRRAGDAAAQAWLAAALAAARPGDAILSEEAADDPVRLTAERVWIIDPLDGTREFGEHRPDGRWRDDFAVHIALWRRARGLTDGAVALPACGVVHSSGTRIPADVAAARAVLDGSRPLRIAVSRSRPPEVAARLAERADVELVPMGSTGVKVSRVLDGTVDAYVHAGGQHEWDSAAPVAVALASGFVATRLDGSPLVYNQPSPWSPDLVVCHPALADHLRRLLGAAGVEPAGGPE